MIIDFDIQGVMYKVLQSPKPLVDNTTTFRLELTPNLTSRRTINIDEACAIVCFPLLLKLVLLLHMIGAAGGSTEAVAQSSLDCVRIKTRA